MENVLEILKTIKKDIKVMKAEITSIRESLDNQQAEIREIVSHKNAIVEELINNIEQKIDVYGNAGLNPNKAAAKKTTAKITTLAFLKQELSDDLYKFEDELYSANDINILKSNPEVKKKKSEAEINNKLISLLHTEIKKNPALIKKVGRKPRSLYSKFKE